MNNTKPIILDTYSILSTINSYFVNMNNKISCLDNVGTYKIHNAMEK